MDQCLKDDRDSYRKTKLDPLYITESVGDMYFYKCKQCPFMTLAENDVESHWYSTHAPFPIRCPGCNNFFETENVIKSHLKDHHKMGSTDVDKLVENIVRIARCNPGGAIIPVISSETKPTDWNQLDTKRIPAVIEIIPDNAVCSNINENNITIITEKELQKLGCHEFEKMSQADVKHIINEASINILCSDDSIEVRAAKERTPSSPCLASEPPAAILKNPVPSNLNYITVNPELQNSSNMLNKSSESLLDKASSEKLKTVCGDDVFDATFQNSAGHKLNLKQSFGGSNGTNDDESPGNDEKMCTFTNCNVKLRSLEKLNYHIKCHQNGKLCCPECRRFFIYIEHFHTHLWKSHNIDMELYSCDLCPYKTFSKNSLINSHLESHNMDLQSGKSQKASYKPIGKKRQPNIHSKKYKKDVHKRKTQENTEYVCELCQRSYAYLNQLRLHVSNVHAKLKPFICDQCEYSVATKSALKLHQRSHNGEKPFECEHCEFKTGDHNSLRRHKKRHTQEMTYKCKHCNYSCIQSKSYKEHMKSKHPGVETDNYYSCPFCKYKSVNRLNYITHLSTHNNQEGVPLLIEMTMSRIINGWVPTDQEEKINEAASLLTKSYTTADCIDMKGNPNQTANSMHLNLNTTKVSVEFDNSEISTEIPYKIPKIRNSENVCLNSSNNQNGGFDMLQNFPTAVTDFGQEDNNSDCVLLEGSEDAAVAEMHSQNINSMIPAFFAVSSKPNDAAEPSPKSVSHLSSPLMFAPSNAELPILSLPQLLPMSEQPIVSCSNDVALNTVDNAAIAHPLVKPMLSATSLFQTQKGQTINLNHAPRKEPNISVKSNLILKGPDEVNNTFHTQQKMAFQRLEDNQQRISLPILASSDFVNLSSLYANDQSELNNVLVFSNDILSNELAPIQDKLVRGSPGGNLKLFNIGPNKTAPSVSSPGLLTNSSDNIKMETKQSLSFMNYEKSADEVRLVSTEELLSDYSKASHRLENISKEDLIKNEHTAEMFANGINLGGLSMVNCMQSMDTTLENVPGFNVNYSHNTNMEYMVLPDSLQGSNEANAESNDFPPDVIEIDDTSNDMKLLPHMNLALSMDYINSVCDINLPAGFMQTLNDNGESDKVQVKEKPRIISEVYISGDRSKVFNFRHLGMPNIGIDQPVNFMHGVNDPMMNSSVRPAGSKLSVKNIETMIGHSRD